MKYILEYNLINFVFVRPDRDKFILVKWENLKNPQSKVNFEQYNTKFWNDHPLPYDYSSIMHYSGDAFSKEYGLKTIVPKVKPDFKIKLLMGNV